MMKSEVYLASQIEASMHAVAQANADIFANAPADMPLVFYVRGFYAAMRALAVAFNVRAPKPPASITAVEVVR